MIANQKGGKEKTTSMVATINYDGICTTTHRDLIFIVRAILILFKNYFWRNKKGILVIVLFLS